MKIHRVWIAGPLLLGLAAMARPAAAARASAHGEGIEVPTTIGGRITMVKSRMRRFREHMNATSPRARRFKIASAVGGFVLGGASGLANHGTRGVVRGAVDTIDVKPFSVSYVQRKARLDGQSVNVEIESRRLRVAGIYKTGLWGLTGIGLAYFGLPPEKWPMMLDQVGGLAIEYGKYALQPLLPEAALAKVSDAFLAGVGLRGVHNLVVGGLRDGLYGLAVGGLEGAQTGVELVEKVIDEKP